MLRLVVTFDLPVCRCIVGRSPAVAVKTRRHVPTVNPPTAVKPSPAAGIIYLDVHISFRCGVYTHRIRTHSNNIFCMTCFSAFYSRRFWKTVETLNRMRACMTLYRTNIWLLLSFLTRQNNNILDQLMFYDSSKK